MQSGLELVLYLVAIIAGGIIIGDYIKARNIKLPKFKKHFTKLYQIIKSMLPKRKHNIGIYNYNSSSKVNSSEYLVDEWVGHKTIRNNSMQPNSPYARLTSNFKLHDIVSIRLEAAHNEFISGSVLQDIFAKLDLEFGNMNIFHHYAANGESLFSIASANEPGSFNLEHMQFDAFSGLTIFMQLIITEESMSSKFEKMLLTAKFLASALECEIIDENGEVLSDEKIESTRLKIKRLEKKLATDFAVV